MTEHELAVSMTEHGPAVSRLCVATAANGSGRSGRYGPLRSVQESGGFYRLHLTTDPADGAEFAVAAPGLDEVSLVCDLIAALRNRVTIAPELRQPVLAGFHVGIIRLTDSGFGGSGVKRVLALIRDPAIVTQASAATTATDSAPVGPRLAVAITAGLFKDLRAEGLPGDGWQPVPAADAWLRLFNGRQALR